MRRTQPHTWCTTRDLAKTGSIHKRAFIGGDGGLFRDAQKDSGIEGNPDLTHCLGSYRRPIRERPMPSRARTTRPKEGGGKSELRRRVGIPLRGPGGGIQNAVVRGSIDRTDTDSQSETGPRSAEAPDSEKGLET